MGEEVGEEEGKGMALDIPLSFLRVFIFRLQAGILGEVPAEGFSRIFISSPGVSFQGHGLL